MKNLTNGQCGDNVFYEFNPESCVLTLSGSGEMEDYNGIETVSPFYRQRYIKEIVIGDNITKISAHAFEKCIMVERISIGKDVEIIDKFAFDYLPFLERAVIPDSVRIIGYRAFANCRGLKSVEMGRGVKRIENFAFAHCCKLEEVVIPDSTELIGCMVFAYCYNLKTAVFPKSLCWIGSDIFMLCRSFEKIYYKGSREELKKATIASLDHELEYEIVYLEGE